MGSSTKRILIGGSAALLLVTHGAGAAPLANQSEPTASAAQAKAERAAARRKDRAERRARRRAVRDHDAPDTLVHVDGREVVVIGLRQSVEDSISRKRDARQMVDVVTAEDAGKLPDNNVVDALARVTGITVTRSGGRADDFTIRGLDGIQTTVNGLDAADATAGGDGRVIDLSSVPAELVKSIEVYKTRTADQPEGGIGGSVNIQLRRPLDLRKGLTVAGSVRDEYAQSGKLWSPSRTLLLADHFDTAIGEIGVLVNGAISTLRYAEPGAGSESPALLGCDTCTIRLSLPEDRRDKVMAPYRAAYGLSSGTRHNRSLSGALQWRASARLNFVLEGSYFGGRSAASYASLFLRTRETITPCRMSDTPVMALCWDMTSSIFQMTRAN